MEQDLIKALEGQGNLLKSLLGIHKKNNTIKIIRVYPYESIVGDCFFSSQKKYIKKGPEEKAVLSVINEIEKKLENLKGLDNKIVVELVIGYHTIFLGLCDEQIAIGESVKPCQRSLPCCRISKLKIIEPVIVRE